MKTLGLTLYLPEKQPAQWTNCPFNSLTRMGGRVLGASDTGIYVLGEDEDDAGTEIAVQIEFPKTDLGIANPKRLRRMDVTAKGELEITFQFENGESVTRTLSTEDDRWLQHVLPSYRALIGQVLQVTVRNLAGSDFALESIKLIPTVRSR